jgi:hypothetical protein
MDGKTGGDAGGLDVAELALVVRYPNLVAR